MKRLQILLLGLLLCVGGYAQELEKFSEGSKWGFHDAAGNVVVPAKYDVVGDFSEGLIAVRLYGKWGYIDTLGNEIISPKYDAIVSGFFEGFTAVCLNKKWGYIDTLGNEISPKYDVVERFSEGVALVNLNGKWGYIDKAGEEVSTNRPLPLETPATIKVIRRKSMLGAIVPYNVYLNNKYVGDVKNGGTLEIPVFTSHNVVIVSDGIGPFEGNYTVVLEGGGYVEVYVKARRFVDK